MIKIAIVDDDLAFANTVSKNLAKILNTLIDGNYEIKIFVDGLKLLESQENYDLLLLDIDMPSINGFDLVKEVSKNALTQNDPEIIYISNYEDLVFESFRYSPLRFVRKTKLEAELSEAIYAFLKKQKNNNYRIMVSTSFGKRSIVVNDIIYIEVKSHKLNIHEKTQLIVANGNLKDVEESLCSHGFIKTHQSFLVNYKYINFINHSEVILDNGTLIPLSRGRYEQVKKDYMINTREQ